MTNAFHIAPTLKLRTLSYSEHAAQAKAIEGSSWEQLGVAREDLEKSLPHVAFSADVDLLLPFAGRFWSESI